MVVNADKMKAELAKETGQDGRFIFKLKDDPRITPVGKFIRKFSIDEFPPVPQCVQGDMSVGRAAPAAAGGSGSIQPNIRYPYAGQARHHWTMAGVRQIQPE